MGAQSPDTAREYLSSTLIDTAAGGDVVIAAAVATKKVRLYRLLLNCHAAQLVTVKDSADTVLLPQVSMGATGGLVLDFDGHSWVDAATGLGLKITLANAVQTSGKAWYTQRGEP